MEIRTFFTLAELEDFGEPAETLVIFDIFGASTMITAALTHGGLRIVPVAAADEAIKLGKILGRDNVILCGENDGGPIVGFDIGNSPLEYDSVSVGGKLVIYLSEELTGIIGSPNATGKILLGSFNNITALAEIAKETNLIHILCSGRGKTLSFEDAVCAGMLVDILASEQQGEKGLNDTAVTARYMYGHHANDIFGLLKDSGRGEKLIKENRQQDLEYIAQIGRTEIVAQLAEDRTHFYAADISGGL